MMTNYVTEEEGGSNPNLSLGSALSLGLVVYP